MGEFCVPLVETTEDYESWKKDLIKEYNITKGPDSENYESYIKELEQVRLWAIFNRMNNSDVTFEIFINDPEANWYLDDLFQFLQGVTSEEDLKKIPEDLKDVFNTIYNSVDKSDLILD